MSRKFLFCRALIILFYKFCSVFIAAAEVSNLILLYFYNYNEASDSDSLADFYKNIVTSFLKEFA